MKDLLLTIHLIHFNRSHKSSGSKLLIFLRTFFSTFHTLQWCCWDMYLTSKYSPSICISLEILLTSSWERPSVRTTKTLGTPLLAPPSAVKMDSFTCLMARPDRRERQVNEQSSHEKPVHATYAQYTLHGKHNDRPHNSLLTIAKLKARFIHNVNDES